MDLSQPLVRVLVTGSANGKLIEFFKAVNKINTKYGPFDFLLCVGDLFDETNEKDLTSLLANEITVPIESYFMRGKNPLPTKIKELIETKDGEVCRNLKYLGEYGSIRTTHGVKIAFAGGSPESSDINISSVDILVSHQWPKGITRFSQKNLEKDGSRRLSYDFGSQCISDIAINTKPRYHFATEAKIFYEREPYMNAPDPTEKMENMMAIETRIYPTWFIGLAEVANPEKHKWYYGFNLVPLSRLGNFHQFEIPGNKTTILRPLIIYVKYAKFLATGSKIVLLVKNVTRKDIERPTCEQKGHYFEQCPLRKPIAKPCWFCLRNPQLEKHMVLSVASEIYMAVAKGGLIDTTNELVSPIVPGGGHVLIISLAHYETFFQAPPDINLKMLEEIENYKNGLRTMYKHFGADLLTYQVSIQGGWHHAHIQAIPIPLKYSSKNIKNKFIEEAKAAGWAFDEAPAENPDMSNFRVELPDQQILSYNFKKSRKFDQQFGRKVIAKLLGCPDRASWKACALEETKEREDRDHFMAAFKEFDFTLKETILRSM
ncbi:hypothetical protein G9A89_018962 [Geosiphon pyriformis]|nr:hypothetical protein G9A89_018962 [Geosiphon pyriformis]